MMRFVHCWVTPGIAVAVCMFAAFWGLALWAGWPPLTPSQCWPLLLYPAALAAYGLFVTFSSPQPSRRR